MCSLGAAMGLGMALCHLLLLSLVAHWVSSQPSGEETHRAGEVIKWIEVYNRSYCQPKEQMVSINTEYPAEVEHIFLPSCVPLRRCSGCCVDEEIECAPTKMHVVIMQIMKTKFMNTQIVEVPFVEHSQCECRPKKYSKLKPERPHSCGPCPDRRKHHQDPLTCQCTCKRSAERCLAKGQELNEHTCKCEKLRR